MKKRSIFIVLFIFLGWNNSVVASDQKMNDIEQKRLSAKILLIGAADQVVKRDIPKNLIYEYIYSDKSAHKEINQSRVLCQEFVDKDFMDALKKSSDTIFRRLNLYESDKVWCDQLFSTISKQKWGSIKQNIANKFKNTFKDDREKAVLKQRETIISLSRPETEADLILVEKGDPRLQQILFDRSMQHYTESLYLENITDMNSRINDIIIEANRQYKKQLEIVGSSTGGGQQERSLHSIERHIYDELDFFRSKIADAYSLFPSIKKLIPEKSNDLSFSKFNTWSSSWDYTIPLAELIDEIKKDITRHIDRLESEKVIIDSYRKKLSEKMFDEYASGLSEEEYSVLKSTVTAHTDYASMIEKNLPRSISEIAKAREQISDQQFKSMFPDLLDNSWVPENTVIDQRHNKSNSSKKDIEMKVVIEKISGKTVLDETKTLVINRIHNRLQEGDDAISHQFRLVTNFSEKMKSDQALEEFLNEFSIDQLRTDQIIKDVTDIVYMKILNIWKTEPLSKHYDTLFNKVKDEIARVVKELILKEIERREKIFKDEQKKAQQQKIDDVNRLKQLNASSFSPGKDGEQTSPEVANSKKAKGDKPGDDKKSGRGGLGGGIGNGGDNQHELFEADILIDVFWQPPSEIQVKYKIKERNPFIKTYDTKKILIDSSDQRLPDINGQFINYFKTVLKQKQPPAIYILVKVRHEKIPYGFVYIIRETVREMLDEFNEKVPDLRWYDGYLPDIDEDDGSSNLNRPFFWQLSKR